MAEKNPNSKKKVTCLDCDHEFVLDSDGQGACPECDLDMGAILTRHRHENALQKLRDANKKEPPKPPKRGSPFGL